MMPPQSAQPQDVSAILRWLFAKSEGTTPDWMGVLYGKGMLFFEREPHLLKELPTAHAKREWSLCMPMPPLPREKAMPCLAVAWDQLDDPKKTIFKVRFGYAQPDTEYDAHVWAFRFETPEQRRSTGTGAGIAGAATVNHDFFHVQYCQRVLSASSARPAEDRILSEHTPAIPVPVADDSQSPACELLAVALLANYGRGLLVELASAWRSIHLSDVGKKAVERVASLPC